MRGPVIPQKAKGSLGIVLTLSRTRAEIPAGVPTGGQVRHADEGLVISGINSCQCWTGCYPDR